jgi:hypothetical protein
MMKRLRFLSLFVLLIFVVAVPVFGATPEYLPSEISLTIAPGSSSEMPFTLDVEICYSHVYDVLFVDRIEGNLPHEWVSASPSSSFMVCKGPSTLFSMLKVTVPDTTAPGDYSGYLFSRAIGAHGFTEPGEGIYIEVHVPYDCGSAPEIHVDSVELTHLWSPKGTTEPVAITGRIILPEGCAISEAGYSIYDEYDILTGIDTITLGPDYSFSAAVPLAVSRKLSDKDGRSYTITIYAANEAGIGQSQSMQLVVQRDQGDNKIKSKQSRPGE